MSSTTESNASLAKEDISLPTVIMIPNFDFLAGGSIEINKTTKSAENNELCKKKRKINRSVLGDLAPTADTSTTIASTASISPAKSTPTAQTNLPTKKSIPKATKTCKTSVPVKPKASNEKQQTQTTPKVTVKKVDCAVLTKRTLEQVGLKDQTEAKKAKLEVNAPPKKKTIDEELEELERELMLY